MSTFTRYPPKFVATTLASDHVLAVLYKPYVFPDAPTQTEEAPARPPVGLLDVVKSYGLLPVPTQLLLARSLITPDTAETE